MSKEDPTRIPRIPTEADESRSFSWGVMSIVEGMASIIDFGQSNRLRRRMTRRLDHTSPENWFGPKGPGRPWPW